jgi:predicted ATPase/class 3 adenylate cyclase
MTSSDTRESALRQVEVAILFTDIEGSTARWDADAAAMREQLARHDEVLVRSIAENGGLVVKHTGDGFLARFNNGKDATAAAVTAQMRLAELDFSIVGGLRIRAAVDEGPVEDRNGDLYGPPLNRCARVMDAAHGGQVLTSESIWEDLHDDAMIRVGQKDDPISFIDLGLHRLKGLARPQRLFQVLHAELQQHFPPPRSLNSSLGNLPIDVSSVLGREELVRRVSELLDSPGVVTLIGPGGVGKTSLALRVGHEVIAKFPDGTWFVDLAPVRNARGVAGAITRTMGVARRAGQTLEATLRDVLSSRQALLILDNAEHLAEVTRDLVSQVLVHGSPSRILVTSRIPLGGAAETKIRVDPLATPDRLGVNSLRDALSSPAVALFVERAQVARPGFALTEENFADAMAICDDLDGLPLAIELAAARTEVMSLSQISARLDDRFRLLQAGPDQDPRHRTLVATLDWSYENLSLDAQRLFARLSVAASSFELDTATALAASEELDVVDQLGELVHNSMVATDHGGTDIRYRLIETMRDYASLRLEEFGEASDAGDRHGDFFGEMALTLRRSMWTTSALDALDRCRLELPDLRRAFERSLGAHPTSALTMATDLYALWLIRDLVSEGRRWLEEAIGAMGGTANARPSPELVAALDDAGTLAWMMGNTKEAERYLETALTTAERLGTQPPPKALVRLGSIRTLAGDRVEGLRLCRLARSLALDLADNVESLMVVERTLGAVLSLSGAPEEGMAICEQAIARARNTDLWLASALSNMAYATAEIDPSRAIHASLEAIEESRRIGSRYYQGSAWSGLGLARLTSGDVPGSCRAYGEALTHMLDSGARQNVLISLFKMSEALIDVAPESAIVLAAGVAKLQIGPGSDGTWHDARYRHLRNQVGDLLDDRTYERAWKRGTELALDALVVLARETVDEAWPELVPER